MTKLACKPARCLAHRVLFQVLESRIAELIAARLGTIDSGKDARATIERATQKVVLARTLLNDHVSGCSRCARWLM